MALPIKEKTASVGASLLAMAVCQLYSSRQIHRYREQARSHRKRNGDP